MATAMQEAKVYEVLLWGEDEAEYLVDFIEAFTKEYAEKIMKSRVFGGAYPKGSYLERNQGTDRLAAKHAFARQLEGCRMAVGASA